MKRRAFNVMAGVSLVVCAATCALWARSYFQRDYIAFNSADGNRHSILSERGTLVLERHSNVVYFGTHVPALGWSYKHRDAVAMIWRSDTAETQWHFAGFGLLINRGIVGPYDKNSLNGRRQGAWQNNVVLVPLWAVLAVFVIPVALRAKVAMRERRLAGLGLCARCGYDLRASPERCPECGAAVGSAAEVGI